MIERILTLGPASENPDILKAMTRVATRFRLNASHLSPEKLGQWLDRLKTLNKSLGRTVPVVIDLQGAKVRIGDYPKVQVVPEAMELRFSHESNDPGIIPVPFESVFLQTQVGDLLHLNDRKVILRILDKPSPHRILTECVQNGELGPGKGLNCPERIFELAKIHPKDQKAMNIGLDYPFAEFAVSFVSDGSEAPLFRAVVGGRRLIAKIERSVALRSLEAIDGGFDELWFCRGDLGAETELRDLGHLQGEFVKAFPRLKAQKILAGEVLGSMIRSPMPSRSEIVHLHDILKAGFDGIVLSDETAVGNHVPEVIRFLDYFFRTQ